MPVWHVYIVRCADGSLYTGIALDVNKRLASHRARRGSKYLRSKLPIRLVYREKLFTKSRALKREAAIKRLTPAQKRTLVKRKTLLPK